MTTPTVLREIGELLHGPDFVPALAKDLREMNPRNLQRMLAGDKEIPEGLKFELLELVDARREVIAEKLGLCGWFSNRAGDTEARPG